MSLHNVAKEDPNQENLDDLYVMPVKRYNLQTNKPLVEEGNTTEEDYELQDLPPPPQSPVLNFDELYAPPPQIKRQKLITTNVTDEGDDVVDVRKKSLRGPPPKPPPRMD